ncbi:SDR family oxidoreductase [Gloeocapsopsis crepidinum LEGE 06123]|uniref:SDR family oxidoreductase n=1 Tax=Gloeocapsopsis crepidinum LEGE 06123 TaxID=588587 RepID=A0ABR9UZA7_9CHRO|nr:SDR family oxidoreductase [Gloeocapsopsis crepidinum]MBE9193616.1 SDR family oxidoreductase [Gloeocapsopsis crepidinum LEGE 06123]
MARLNNKTAVITGGTTGIGFETAKQFVVEGARVMITGQNEERLQSAAKELGETVIPVRADVRSLHDLIALAAQVKAEFGGLDILFANAGIGLFAPLDVIDEVFYDDQFDINVKGVFFTVQKLAELLNKGASVILNASAVSEKGAAMGSVYFATKAAVRSLARTLAAELASRKIRVNALSPGFVLTDFQNKMGLAPEVLNSFGDYIKQSAPLGRFGAPEEIALSAVFLASDESSYMTAADLVVDGGFMNV